MPDQEKESIHKMEIKNVWVTKRSGEVLIGNITKQENGDFKFSAEGEYGNFWVCIYKKENLKWQATRGSNKTKNYDYFEIEQIGKSIETHMLSILKP